MNEHVVSALSQRIFEEFGYTVHCCGEIECLFDHTGSIEDQHWRLLLDAAQAEKIALESIGREQTGYTDLQQYEFRFYHTDPLAAAQAIDWLRQRLPQLIPSARFSAYDAKNGLCCGLHWHLHLLDAAGNYVFFKQEEQLSAPLSAVLGGMLATLPVLMPHFIANETALKRLVSGADHVPRTCSWGGNNRTVALRLPESVVPHRHIEHRVCGADADALAAIYALLVGVHYGLFHHPHPGEQCYGDANRPGAAYPALPLTQADIAAARAQASDWLAEYEGA